MRSEEFTSPQTTIDPQNAKLVSVLNVLRTKGNLKPKTQTLIKMVNSIGVPGFNYNLLVKAIESNPAVKNLIKDFNENEIVIKSTESSSDVALSQTNHAVSPEQTVDTMAKRALGRRS